MFPVLMTAKKDGEGVSAGTPGRDGLGESLPMLVGASPGRGSEASSGKRELSRLESKLRHQQRTMTTYDPRGCGSTSSKPCGHPHYGRGENTTALTRDGATASAERRKGRLRSLPTKSEGRSLKRAGGGGELDSGCDARDGISSRGSSATPLRTDDSSAASLDFSFGLNTSSQYNMSSGDYGGCLSSASHSSKQSHPRGGGCDTGPTRTAATSASTRRGSAGSRSVATPPQRRGSIRAHSEALAARAAALPPPALTPLAQPSLPTSPPSPPPTARSPEGADDGLAVPAAAQRGYAAALIKESNAVRHPFVTAMRRVVPLEWPHTLSGELWPRGRVGGSAHTRKTRVPAAAAWPYEIKACGVLRRAVTSRVFFGRDVGGVLALGHPLEVVVRGRTWRSAEHFFHAMKFAGTRYERVIADAADPAEAAVELQVPLRHDWAVVRDAIMLETLSAKYLQHTGARKALLRTNVAALVCTDSDTYWGVNSDGVGRNRAGALLEQIRCGIFDGSLT